MSIPVTQVNWLPCWRIIPSRFPPINLFERVADPADLDAIVALESLTNERLREEVGALKLVPVRDRISGRGTSYIMAAFTHLNPAGSRFSDGTYGVFYTADTLDTAMAETRHHREQFMRATSEPPMELDMRVLLADLDQQLHDIRGMHQSLPDAYAPDDYSASQALGKWLRAQDSWGIVYDSVRLRTVSALPYSGLQRCVTVGRNDISAISGMVYESVQFIVKALGLDHSVGQVLNLACQPFGRRGTARRAFFRRSHMAKEKRHGTPCPYRWPMP